MIYENFTTEKNYQIFSENSIQEQEFKLITTDTQCKQRKIAE